MAERAQCPHDLIVVEGPIGVGKTSLVRRLVESLGCASLLERAEENPFLEGFYRDPQAAAFPAQLHFLFQRSRQFEQLSQRDLFARRLVADFMLEKDRLFAEMNLSRDELALYDEVYARLTMRAPTPDLVVYLQAPVDVLMARVRRRNRAIEAPITAEYLARLSETYARFFGRYEGAPVLVVDAAAINPVDSEQDYRELLAAICAPARGRRYFNPPPLAIH